MLSDLAAAPNTTKVFNSSSIPGEIIDIMMVNTETLKENPNFGKALVGAWYEMMGLMSSSSEAGIAARTEMAKASGTDLAGFDAQLTTTQMFYKPAEAVAFTKDEKLPQNHAVRGEVPVRPRHSRHRARRVRISSAWSSRAARSLGDTSKVKLRFDPTYMEMAAAGKL